MRVGSLFSGIGGLDLGLERAGMEIVWQCEIDPFCRAVLAHHWPGVRCYEDIHEITGDAEPVELLCGGFPCQPVSLVGSRKAQSDPRWLWPQFARIIGLLQPKYVLVENVPGLATAGFGDVLGSLSTLGYDAEWDVISAASVDAPHLRERLFVVAYTRGTGRQQVARGPHADEGEDGGRHTQEGNKSSGNGQGCGQGPVADADSQPMVWLAESWREPDPWPVEPEVDRMVNGVPHRVVRPQLKALGNSVVPQVAEYVGGLILDSRSRRNILIDRDVNNF